MSKKIAIVVFIFIFSVTISGCAVSFYKASPRDKLKIKELTSEVERLEALRDQETARLKEAMEDLERKLKREIKDKQVRLDMAQRGLVITFVAEVLFDSGRDVIRQEAYSVLDKVGDVIKSKVSDRDIGIEGYTDNAPIVHSGWKSNWELSTARATSVLHYLTEKVGLRPGRLSATGYGEYRPVSSNETESGRQLNRRVEIVILPKATERLKAELLEEDAALAEGIK